LPKMTLEHHPFSHAHFWAASFLLVGSVTPFLCRLFRCRRTATSNQPMFSFPWWGWLAFGGVILSWILAWNRYEWVTWTQRYTFLPLWISYIVLVNALTYRRTGNCLLLAQLKTFLLLFFLSAFFWWFFEYLNRFVQNWHYVTDGELKVTPLEYWVHSTLAFSTVLPAFYGTYQLLFSFQFLREPFEAFWKISFNHPKWIAGLILLISAIGLSALSLWPDHLFPLLWISPLLMISSMQVLFNEEQFFSDVTKGDWSRIWIAAVSALVCGIFWEMWNYHSLLRWEYAIPYLHGYKIFEMPVLGYFGYLGFGLECLVVIEFFTRRKVE
jgi:hypothetical protein